MSSVAPTPRTTASLTVVAALAFVGCGHADPPAAPADADVDAGPKRCGKGPWVKVSLSARRLALPLNAGPAPPGTPITIGECVFVCDEQGTVAGDVQLTTGTWNALVDGPGLLPTLSGLAVSGAGGGFAIGFFVPALDAAWSKWMPIDGVSSAALIETARDPSLPGCSDFGNVTAFVEDQPSSVVTYLAGDPLSPLAGPPTPDYGLIVLTKLAPPSVRVRFERAGCPSITSTYGLQPGTVMVTRVAGVRP